MQGRTVIAIAHRLTTLSGFDRLITLEGGHIVRDVPPEQAGIPLAAQTTAKPPVPSGAVERPTGACGMTAAHRFRSVSSRRASARGACLAGLYSVPPDVVPSLSTWRTCMRIAQIAPLAEAVPPKFYGGTERVVSWLTEELVRQGHDVTLFASGDSVTNATLVAGTEKGLRLQNIGDHTASNLVMLDTVRRRAHEFDIIHCHIDLLQFPMFQDMGDKVVTTMHGRLDLPDFLPVYKAYPHMPLVSISDCQREPMPANVNWLSTVYHGLPAEVCPFVERGGDYLAFLGRISPEKRPRSRDPHRKTGRHQTQDRRQGRQRRSQILRRDDQAVDRRRPVDRVHRRDRRNAEMRLPRQCSRLALPHRLARTVRSRHDRGHVRWDARHRLAQRLGAPK